MTIQQLFFTHGTLLESGTNASFFLNSHDKVWYLDRGGVELFTVDCKGEEAKGRRFHLCSITSNSILFSMDGINAPSDFACLAIMQQDTCLYSLDRQQLLTALDDSTLFQECVNLSDKWIHSLSLGTTQKKIQKCEHYLHPGKEAILSKGERITSDSDLLWLQCLEGESIFLDIFTLPLSSLPFPLSSRAWIQAETDCRFHTFVTADLLKILFFSRLWKIFTLQSSTVVFWNVQVHYSLNQNDSP